MAPDRLWGRSMLHGWRNGWKGGGRVDSIVPGYVVEP